MNDNFGSPYQKINNVQGYDQSRILGIVRNFVCSECGGSLIKGHHPKTFTFTISCRNPDCPGDTIVSKHYLEAIEKKELQQGDEFYQNFKDIINGG